MFREVTLPLGIQGRLLLHCMPGWYESWDEFQFRIMYAKVSRIVCLTGPGEIKRKSPWLTYADRIISRNTV